jgi:hypothetical protein
VTRTQWDETEVSALQTQAARTFGKNRGPVVTSVLPTVDDDPEELAQREIEYSATDRTDTMVISGPLPHGGGPGRAFQTAGDARRWAIGKYGQHAVLERLRDAEWGGRWAFVVVIPGSPRDRLLNPPPDYTILEEVL